MVKSECILILVAEICLVKTRYINIQTPAGPALHVGLYRLSIASFAEMPRCCLDERMRSSGLVRRTKAKRREYFSFRKVLLVEMP